MTKILIIIYNNRFKLCIKFMYLFFFHIIFFNIILLHIYNKLINKLKYIKSNY